jgi:hypothetical protein
VNENEWSRINTNGDGFDSDSRLFLCIRAKIQAGITGAFMLPD